MISFTQIPAILKYPSNIRGKLSTLHSEVITYVIDHYEGKYSQQQKIINVMNTISYLIISGDSMPVGWSADNPLVNIDIVDDDECMRALGELHIMAKHIEWDISPVEVVEAEPEIIAPKAPILNQSPLPTKADLTIVPTPKEDLYIKPPTVPRFDSSRPWLNKLVGRTRYVIYSSIPDIPTKQNEISVTTDVNKIASHDLRKLFPNHFIRTRSEVMYERIPGLDYHEMLGTIIPIQGFSYDQIVDNIVKYPHIFRLMKFVDGKIVNFYTTLEIDGTLHKISDIWNTLPESLLIPYNADFIKEYVVRRYLLERDIKHITHKYPIYGSLDPFLTLFTTPVDYMNLGYTNIEDLAKQCVKSRVSYKQTRNPILRRLQNA